MAPPRRILRQQLEILIDFLEDNKDMSKGLPPGPPMAHQVTRQKWAALAKKLNAVPSGALKAPDGWKKYWFEWRHKCRKKAANAKRLLTATTPNRFVPLNDLEIRVLDLSGDGAVTATISSSEQLDNFLDENSNSDQKLQENAFPCDVKTSQEIKYKSISETDGRIVTPPPKWALLLEERRIAAEERSAVALESIASILKSHEERRGVLEERISDAITALAGSMQDVSSGLQEVIQRMHHVQSPSNNEPMKEVVFL